MPYINWNCCAKDQSKSFIATRTAISEISRLSLLFNTAVEDYYLDGIRNAFEDFFIVFRNCLLRPSRRFPNDDLYLDVEHGEIADLLRDIQKIYENWEELTEDDLIDRMGVLQKQLIVLIEDLEDMPYDKVSIILGIYDRETFEEEFGLVWKDEETVFSSKQTNLTNNTSTS